jgi:hypothetical protein
VENGSRPGSLIFKSNHKKGAKNFLRAFLILAGRRCCAAPTDLGCAATQPYRCYAPLLAARTRARKS